ncbi:MAG: hypothetical protein HOV70_20115 [Streptomyces sp.]|nr:hypothetical protein [Streptomyces sp.]
MGLFDRLLGNDHERAAKYDGPSASETAAAKRRAGHRRSVPKAAAEGQAWEARDRKQDRKGIWYRAAR